MQCCEVIFAFEPSVNSIYFHEMDFADYRL